MIDIVNKTYTVFAVSHVYDISVLIDLERIPIVANQSKLEGTR